MASAEPRLEPVSPLVRWFEDIGARDVLLVGGKAASLGEMFGALTGKGVRIPNGFATTVAAYDQFLEAPVVVEKWAALSEEARRLNPDVLRTSTVVVQAESDFRGKRIGETMA